MTRLSGFGWVKEQAMEKLTPFMVSRHRYQSSVPFTAYRFALHCVPFLFEDRDFYLLDPELICKFVADLGAITMSEAITVTHKLVLHGTICEPMAIEILSNLLTSMRVLVSENSVTCVSPSVDEEIYKKVVGKGFVTQWNDKLWKPELFDFSDQQRKEERERQLAEDRSKCFDVPHDIIAAMAATTNHGYLKNMPSDTKLCPWSHWKPKVWALPRCSDWLSEWGIQRIVHHQLYDFLCYVISLMPELMYVSVFGDERDETIATFILKQDLPKWQEHLILNNLHKMGCNLSLPNDDGQRPVDLAKRGSTMELLKSFGCNVSERSENGDSSLEVNSRIFNRDILKRLLENGADVLDPNPKEGWFWIPWVLKNKYYGKLGFDDFQTIVRERMRGNRLGDYFKNEICMEIVGRPIENWAVTDSKDLLNSVTSNNFERAKVLVALGAPTEARNEEGNTCLLICAEKGNIEMAKLLLQNFANRHVLNTRGENCFRVACARGNFEIAKLFHSEGVDIDSRALDGSTTLHFAYCEGSESTLDFCLNEGCSPNVNNANGLTVQFLAYQDRKDQLAERIQNDYNGNINACDNDKNSLAHLAYKTKDIERIRYLSQRGIDLELKNKHGRTVFMEAVMEHNQEMCEPLLGIGCDINTCDPSGQSGLMIAYLSHDMSLFDFLLERKCDPNIQEDKTGKTVLMMALEKLDFAACDALIAHKADLNIRDNNGRSAILRCVVDSKYSRRTFDYLIQKGCAVSVIDRKNWHLLSYLIKANMKEEATIVLQRKDLTVTCPDCGDGEPIVVALNVNSQYWFEELVKRGADAMNHSWPVTEKYLRQRWFSIDCLRRMRKYNIGIGAPLQYAMESNMRDVVDLLWNSSGPQMRREASETRDSYKRTPLMQAIRLGVFDLASALISRGFKCDGRDSQGLSPILYAARAGNMQWTSDLYDIVGPEGAEEQDSDGNSALTYADNNGWRQMCDHWFIDGIDVRCNSGNNGFVSKYRRLLKDHKELVRKAQSLLRQAERKLSSRKNALAAAERDVKTSEFNIRSIEKNIADKQAHGSSTSNAMSSLKMERKALERRTATRNQVSGHVRIAEGVVSTYESVVSRVESASRHDILYNIESLAREACNEKPLRSIPS